MPAKSIKENIKEIIATDSFQYYEEDQLTCLEKWQYWEPASTSNDVRFELDVEAYKKAFFNTPHIHDLKYDEKLLLKLLIRNLEKAKHPAFIEYREYLGNKIKSPKPKQVKEYTYRQVALVRLFRQNKITKTNITNVLKEFPKLKSARELEKFIGETIDQIIKCPSKEVKRTATNTKNDLEFVGLKLLTSADDANALKDLKRTYTDFYENYKSMYKNSAPVDDLLLQVTK